MKVFLVTSGYPCVSLIPLLHHSIPHPPSSSSTLLSDLPPLCRFLPPPVRDSSRIFVIVRRNPVHHFPSRSGNPPLSLLVIIVLTLNYKSNISFPLSLPLHSVFLFHVTLSITNLFSSSISAIKYTILPR